MLRQEYPDLDLSSELTATRNWALNLLQNESATVRGDGSPDSVAEGDSLCPVEVRVTNLTGHKLPTGYPEGRRMWLNVQARDGDDVLIWESGCLRRRRPAS